VRVATLVALFALAVPGSALARIRLAGAFAMTGRITSAHAVPGEHAGEKVTRAWAFQPLCPARQCRTEELVRSRATGEDKLRLHRPARVFGHWTGQGSFFAPLRCGRRVYPRGERVFFTIKVRITGATVVDGVLLATSLKATYKSYRRTNRTRCVAALGHDAAVYTGTLTPAPYPIAPPTPTPAPG
jgi:hypothetical protein